MSGLVFVDDENNDVLDAWMNDTSGGFVKGPVESIEPVTSKGGLGFVASSSGSKQKDSVSKKNVDKIASKKRGRQDSFDDELHGIVGDIDESRTSAIKSNLDKKLEMEKKKAEIAEAKLAKKAKAAEKPNTFAGPPSQQHNNHNSNKTTNPAHVPSEKNIKQNANNNGKNAQQGAVAASGKPSQKVTGNNKATPSSATSATSSSTPTAAEGNGPDTAPDASTEKEEGRVNSRIRKRTKTRSKQKNIRRDNRADGNKPAHLQAGNKEYHGRPLTEATKTVLGLVSNTKK